MKEKYLSIIIFVTTLLLLSASVFAYPNIIGSADITCDLGTKLINMDFPEGTNANIISGHSTVTTKGAKLDALNTKLMYWEEKYGRLYGISSGSRAINTTRKYYMLYTFVLESGYDWPNELKAGTVDTPLSKLSLFRVNFNGIRVTDGYFKYIPNTNNLNVYVRACNDISKATVTLSGTDFTLDGTVHVPEIKTVVLDGATLMKENYTFRCLDSSRNPVTSPTTTGTYYLLIEGTGIYNGVIERTFQIKPYVNPNSTLLHTKISFTPNKVKNGRKTVVKVTTNSGTALSVIAKNANAKNRKYVKISKAARVVRVTFTNKAVKGKYTFYVIAPATGNYRMASKTITISVTGKTAESAKPAAKDSLSVTTPASGQLTISFKKDSTAHGYEIMISNSSKFPSNGFTRTFTVNKTKNTFRGLPSGKKIFVKVRPYRVLSNKKLQHGTWSKTKSVVVK